MNGDDKKSCELYDWKQKPRSLRGIEHDAPLNWNVDVDIDQYMYKNEIGRAINVDINGWKFIPKSREKELVAFYNQCNNKEDFIKFLEDHYEDVDGAVCEKHAEYMARWNRQDKARCTSVKKQLKENGISVREYIETGKMTRD